MLYPAVGYELPDSWFEALSRAASDAGEHSAYYSAVEDVTAFELTSVWEVTLSPDSLRWFETSATDGSRNPIVENALWSVSGSWRLLVSHRQHVIIGGSPSFVAQLQRDIEGADKQVLAFVKEMLRYREGAAWGREGLPRLLAHAYGVERAQELLRIAADESS